MGHAFSRGTRTKAGGQRSAASGRGKVHRQAAPAGGHDTRGSASKLSAKQSGLSAEGLHQKGEKATKKKKPPVPKIVITGPLEDSASLKSLNDLPESQTIRDVVDYGPYHEHRKPSTVDAYHPQLATA